MLPTDFEDRNILITPASNMPESKSYPYIPGFFGVDGSGLYIFITAWQPSKEDMDAIKAGRPIFVKVYSDHMSPLSLFTRDEIGEINE